MQFRMLEFHFSLGKFSKFQKFLISKLHNFRIYNQICLGHNSWAAFGSRSLLRPLLTRFPSATIKKIRRERIKWFSLLIGHSKQRFYVWQTEEIGIQMKSAHFCTELLKLRGGRNE